MENVLAIQYNFDKFKVDYFKGHSEQASSVDALAFLDNQWAFIEFKNGGVDGKEIRLKAKSSLLMFCDWTQENITFTREHLNFYLVCSNEEYQKLRTSQKSKEPDNAKIKEQLTKKAGKEPLLPLGLGTLKRFFNSVHIHSAEDFKKIAEKIQPIEVLNEDVGA